MQAIATPPPVADLTSFHRARVDLLAERCAANEAAAHQLVEAVRAVADEHRTIALELTDLTIEVADTAGADSDATYTVLQHLTGYTGDMPALLAGILIYDGLVGVPSEDAVQALDNQKEN